MDDESRSVHDDFNMHTRLRWNNHDYYLGSTIDTTRRAAINNTLPKHAAGRSRRGYTTIDNNNYKGWTDDAVGEGGTVRVGGGEDEWMHW